MQILKRSQRVLKVAESISGGLIQSCVCFIMVVTGIYGTVICTYGRLQKKLTFVIVITQW